MTNILEPSGVNVVSTLRQYVRSIIESTTMFDLETFRTFRTYGEMRSYLKLTTRLVGLGAARDAWDTGQGTVVKTGPDPGAVKQNKHEVRVYARSGGSRLLPRVYEHAPDFRWILSELVTPLRSIERVDSAIAEATNGTVTSLELLQRQLRSVPLNGPGWLVDVFTLVRDNDLNINDLHKGNWGLNNENMLVIPDTGK